MSRLAEIRAVFLEVHLRTRETRVVRRTEKRGGGGGGGGCQQNRTSVSYLLSVPVYALARGTVTNRAL